MAFEKKRKLYESLPLAAKRMACLVPFGLIAGKAYREVMARGRWFDAASRSDVLAFQEKKIGETLRFATDQVPAYRGLRGVVDRLSPFDALREFPLVDKEMLQRDLYKYLPRDFDKIPHYETTTSGTSGTQLTIYVDDASQSIETAFIHRLWRCVGYSPRYRKATFRCVPLPDLKPGEYWQHNPIYNELQFSPFHLSEKTHAAYIEQIRQFGVRYLHGYPSSIDMLSEYILRNNLQDRMPRIRASLLGSEGCLPGQKERIAKATGARAFTWYGHSERLVLAGECEKSEDYHVVPDYGYAEIISDDGEVREREGESGEIVGTGFLNKSMPFIRYRTDDYATLLEPECRCGRNWDRLTSVTGHRKQVFLTGAHGARISLAALTVHSRVFDKVIRYQYVQEKAGECDFRVMVAPGYSESDKVAIEKIFSDKMGGEIEMKVKVVDNIPLTPGGKLKLLIGLDDKR